jgi:hypothetical protein
LSSSSWSTALKNEAHDLVKDKLNVVHVCHLEAPPIAQVGFNLLNSGLFRHIKIHEHLLLNVFDHLLHYLWIGHRLFSLQDLAMLSRCRLLLILICPFIVINLLNLVELTH